MESRNEIELRMLAAKDLDRANAVVEAVDIFDLRHRLQQLRPGTQKPEFLVSRRDSRGDCETFRSGPEALPGPFRCTAEATPLGLRHGHLASSCSCRPW